MNILSKYLTPKSKIIIEQKWALGLIGFFDIENSQRCLLIKKVYESLKTNFRTEKDEVVYENCLMGFDIEKIDYQTGKVVQKEYIPLSKPESEAYGFRCYYEVYEKIKIVFYADTLFWSNGTSENPEKHVYYFNINNSNFWESDAKDSDEKAEHAKNNEIATAIKESEINLILKEQGYLKEPHLIDINFNSIIVREKIVVPSNADNYIAISYNNSKTISIIKKPVFKKKKRKRKRIDIKTPFEDYKFESSGEELTVERGVKELKFSDDDRYLLAYNKNESLSVWEILPSLDLKFKNFINRVDKSVLALFAFLFLMIFHFWSSFNTYSSFWEQLENLFIFSIVIVFSFLLAFFNLFLIDFISGEKLTDCTWQRTRYKYIMNLEIFKSKNAIISLVLFQLTNFFLFIFFHNYYFVWLSLLPIVLLFAYLSKYIKRNNKTLFIVLINILISVTVFCIMNFRVIGVYFYWNLTGSVCFINYGYERKGDPLEQIEFLDNIEDWEIFGNLLPGSESSLEFISHGFFNTFVFYLYPILFIILLFNSHYVFLKLLYRNYSKN